MHKLRIATFAITYNRYLSSLRNTCQFRSQGSINSSTATISTGQLGNCRCCRGRSRHTSARFPMGAKYASATRFYTSAPTAFTIRANAVTSTSLPIRVFSGPTSASYTSTRLPQYKVGICRGRSMRSRRWPDSHPCLLFSHKLIGEQLKQFSHNNQHATCICH
jgi:hypothetical protein